MDLFLDTATPSGNSNLLHWEIQVLQYLLLWKQCLQNMACCLLPIHPLPPYCPLVGLMQPRLINSEMNGYKNLFSHCSHPIDQFSLLVAKQFHSRPHALPCCLISQLYYLSLDWLYCTKPGTQCLTAALLCSMLHPTPPGPLLPTACCASYHKHYRQTSCLSSLVSVRNPLDRVNVFCNRMMQLASPPGTRFLCLRVIKAALLTCFAACHAYV